MEKLINIQSELKAPKGQFNAFGKYKYRNCEDILEALKPLLWKHSCTLTLTDEIKEICGVIYVEVIATLRDSESKQEVSSKAQAGIDIHKKGMDIAQTFGSSSSYARKYALNGLFLIDDTKDADSTNEHKPKEEKIKESLTTPRFEKALSLVSEGKYSAEEIKEKYALSQAQIDQLDKVLTIKNS